jgi:hypothetical protein
VAARGLGNLGSGVAACLPAVNLGTGVPAALVAMVGGSLVVHFGVFHLLAALWRARGYACHALFVAPWRARTLGEFWTRRWNVGFAETTALRGHQDDARSSDVDGHGVASITAYGAELARDPDVRERLFAGHMTAEGKAWVARHVAAAIRTVR